MAITNSFINIKKTWLMAGAFWVMGLSLMWQYYNNFDGFEDFEWYHTIEIAIPLLVGLLYILFYQKIWNYIATFHSLAYIAYISIAWRFLLSTITDKEGFETDSDQIPYYLIALAVTTIVVCSLKMLINPKKEM